MAFYVPLTRGYVAAIDEEDAPRILEHRWHVFVPKRGRTLYAVARIRGRLVRMHRFIKRARVGREIDHIDNDGLNNQRANLRACSSRQNKRNQRIATNNTSGFKGVSFDKSHHLWQAVIGVDNRRKRLGYFKSPVDAAHAYDTAAKKLFGSFARLNFQ